LFYKIFIKKNIMNKLILEEIQRMTLLSKYDNSKTLSEQTIPGGISQQAYDKIIALSNQNKKGFRGSYLFPPQQQSIDAEFGTGTYIKFFNNGGEALLKSGVAQTPAAAPAKPATAPAKTAKPAKPAAKPVATPPELKDIKAFQDWLDTNAKGWATGYKDGIINKGQNGGGYGKFGPRTQKAWATYKDQFLKGGTTATQTPPEIEGEDNTQTLDPNDGEFGGGATTAQPAAQPATVVTPPTNDQPLNLQLSPKQAALNALKYGQQ
jgi:hypothetical protein